MANGKVKLGLTLAALLTLVVVCVPAWGEAIRILPEGPIYLEAGAQTQLRAVDGDGQSVEATFYSKWTQGNFDVTPAGLVTMRSQYNGGVVCARDARDNIAEVVIEAYIRPTYVRMTAPTDLRVGYEEYVSIECDGTCRPFTLVSSNPDVISIPNPQDVFFVCNKKGKATLTLTTFTGLTATVKDLVVKEGTAFSLDCGSFLTLGERQSYLLTAHNVSTGKKVKPRYTSDAPRTVSVTGSGRMRAGLCSGVMNVTVIRARKGAEYASVVVTVVPAPESVTLMPREAQISLGGEPLQMVGRMSGNSGSEPSLVKFTSSNKRVATIDKNGRITPRKPGVTVITATTYNGKKSSSTIRVVG